MAYVSRDENGKIDAVYDSPQANAQEYVSINSDELQSFLQQSDSADGALTVLSASDTQLIRVLEDLINTLIDKGVIRFTDLPDVAQQKLINRSKVRGQLSNFDSLMGDDTGIL